MLQLKISIQITKKLCYQHKNDGAFKPPRVKLQAFVCKLKPIAEEYNLSHALREPDLSKSGLGGKAENVVVCEY